MGLGRAAPLRLVRATTPDGEDIAGEMIDLLGTARAALPRQMPRLDGRDGAQAPPLPIHNLSKSRSLGLAFCKKRR
jgi:hypothetical protein